VIKSKSEMPPRGLEIDLTGPEGNAFVLLGYASKLSRQLGYTEEDRACLLDYMKMSSYDALVEIFDKKFGHFITLWR
jgi:hypothetical protein